MPLLAGRAGHLPQVGQGLVPELRFAGERDRAAVTTDGQVAVEVNDV